MGRKKDKTAGCGRSEPRRSSGLRAQAEKSLAEKGFKGHNRRSRNLTKNMSTCTTSPLSGISALTGTG